MEDIRNLSEEDIKLHYITPAVNSAGWDNDHIRMEYFFTDGRVIVQGNQHGRKARKKADYVLFAAKNQPIAIVEAKDNNKPVGGGLQQEHMRILSHDFNEGVWRVRWKIIENN